MNFNALKTEFREFLLNQGISYDKINQEKDFDNLSIFTYNSEFKNFVNQEYDIDLQDENFVNQEYDIDLQDENFELADLFELNVEDGKFILNKENAEDKESAFIVDIVNNLLEDEDFINNIDKYAANDNQENSALDLLNDLFKEKGITKEDDVSLDVNKNTQEIAKTAINSAKNSNVKSTLSNSSRSSANKTPAVSKNSNKDYSQMNTKELQEAYNNQKTEIQQTNQGFSDIVSQNESDIAEAKAKYDGALSEDSIDSSLLENRNQNIDAIAQTDNIINELTLTISTLNSEISILNSDIQVLDSDISALSASLNSLSTASADDEVAQAAIEAQKSSIESQISQLTSQKENLTNQKNELNNQKMQAESNLSDNEAQLQQLEIEKSNIENQILQTCSENTKNALENYNQVRDKAKMDMQSAKENLQNTQNKLKEIETYLKESRAKDIERENKYNQKGNAFSENNGFELIKGDGDTNMGYSVIQPKNLNPDEELPVMVYLHGGGGSERSLYSQIMNNYNLAEGFNGYIICPTAQGEWNNERSAQNIEQILNTFAQTHKIDTNNITVVGHSMGGSGALYMADSDVFKDDDGFKFSKAAAITGYPNTQKDYDIPIALYADNTSKYALENHLLNPDSEDLYVDWVGEAHTNMDNRAFSEDLDGNGRADLLEWLYD